LLTLLKEEFKKNIFFGIDPGGQEFEIFNKLKRLLIQKFKLNIYSSINQLKVKKKFDLIFSIDTLEHIQNIEHTILSAKKMLAKNGKIIIICPNYSFPYEPHFNIPIIINKKITYKFFKRKILNEERKNNSSGLWESINFITAKELESIAFKNSMNIKFFSEISQRLLIRVSEDENFKRRKYWTWLFAYLGVQIFFLKKIKFNFFSKYLPYIHAEITLKTK
jgi:SAM-dependent methyltransferase